MSGFTDPALMELFRSEMETHLPELNGGLLALENGPAQPKRLEALMRAAHSIKGAAKIVGVETAVRVAHVMEDCFVAAQKGQITLTSNAVDVLLRGVDALGRSTSDSGLADAEVESLVTAIGGVREGRAPAPAPAPKPAVPAGDLAAPPGDLDGTLGPRLADLVTRGVSPVRLDLSAVAGIAPEGLALLARVARAAEARTPPPELVAAGASQEVRQLLRLTRLDRAWRAAPAGA
jgi:two-component system sensor histidine kinase and response regulator WspE